MLLHCLAAGEGRLEKTIGGNLGGFEDQEKGFQSDTKRNNLMPAAAPGGSDRPRPHFQKKKIAEGLTDPRHWVL